MRLKRIAAASEKPDASSYSSTTVAAVSSIIYLCHTLKATAMLIEVVHLSKIR